MSACLQKGSNSTLALALGLIALSLGLPYPSDVSVCGHVTVGGILSQVLSTRRALLVEGRRLGLAKIVKCSDEARGLDDDDEMECQEPPQQQAEGDVEPAMMSQYQVQAGSRASALSTCHCCLAAVRWCRCVRPTRCSRPSCTCSPQHTRTWRTVGEAAERTRGSRSAGP